MRHINIDEILLEFAAVFGCCCWFRFSQHPCLNMYVHSLEKSSCEALVCCAVRACFTNIILYLYIVACFLSIPMWACERSKHVCTIVYINAGLCMVCFQNLDVRCRYSFSMLGSMVSVDVICIYVYIGWYYILYSHTSDITWHCAFGDAEKKEDNRVYGTGIFIVRALLLEWMLFCILCGRIYVLSVYSCFFFHPLRNAF